MPSHLHEALLELFRNQPQLAPDLLQQSLGQVLPPFSHTRLASSDVTELAPAEYRADAVVILEADAPVFAAVVEIQLSRDPQKRLVWPVYAAGVRARLKCPAVVLVLCASDAVAAWCSEPIPLGGGSVFLPLVVGPAGVPLITDEAAAQRDPELAVLSVMAHGKSSPVPTAHQLAGVALGAVRHLDPTKNRLYCDLIAASLADAARKAFFVMDMSKYEYQSDFAKFYTARGREEGRQEAWDAIRAVVERLLSQKFGPPDEAIQARLAGATPEQLTGWAERVLTASRLSDVFA